MVQKLFGDHYSVNKFLVLKKRNTTRNIMMIIMGLQMKNEGLSNHSSFYMPSGAIYMAPDNHILDEAHHVPKWVKLSPFVAMLLGFILSYIFYIWRKDLPQN